MSKHSSRGTQWEALRQQVLSRAGHQCEVHGCSEVATTVDHILPKVLGGTDSLDNLQAMCKPHNSKKQDKVITRQNYLNPKWFDKKGILL